MKSEQNQTLECAICLNNAGCPAALEFGKVPRVIHNTGATAHGYLCVIDESGEDYALLAASRP